MTDPRRRRTPLVLALGGVLAKSLADGGFHLAAAQPVGSLSEVG